MNKVELIKAVAEATNNTQKDIKVIMEAVPRSSSETYTGCI